MTIQVTQNTVAPSTVSPGGTAVWTTVATANTDPVTETAALERDIRTEGGDSVTVRASCSIEVPGSSEPVIYDAPTCDDPRVTLTVDPADPTRVTLRVS